MEWESAGIAGAAGATLVGVIKAALIVWDKRNPKNRPQKGDVQAGMRIQESLATFMAIDGVDFVLLFSCDEGGRVRIIGEPTPKRGTSKARETLILPVGVESHYLMLASEGELPTDTTAWRDRVRILMGPLAAEIARLERAKIAT